MRSLVYHALLFFDQTLSLTMPMSGERIITPVRDRPNLFEGLAQEPDYIAAGDFFSPLFTSWLSEVHRFTMMDTRSQLMKTPPQGRLLLSFDCLETREVPSTVTQNFDQIPIGQLPAKWEAYQTQPIGKVAVATGKAVSGTGHLKLEGISNNALRTWYNGEQFANGSTTASVFADSLSPAIVFSRGRNLKSATPTYYSASTTRGLQINLSATVNGKETVLGAVKSKDYVSQKWVQVELSTVGNSVQVSVRRIDTQQYLRPDGTWQAAKIAAITKTDNSISEAGFAGVGRASGSASPVIIDDVKLETATITTPNQPPATPPPASGSNPAATPNIGRKLSHIRIAQLAYSGNPLGTFEQNKLKTSVDLVVPDTSLLGKINDASPSTQQIIYSNVSNLYLDLLRDWNEYADKNRIDRETAFYHVTSPTAWQGSSPSSLPVNLFWSVVRGKADGLGVQNDLTSASRGQANVGVVFGANGEAVSIGYPEKFRELNIDLKKTAGAGFSGVWEYPVAVNAKGIVTQWKILTTQTNTTNNLTKSGQITFDPPSDWVAGRTTETGQRLNFVRFRTTSGVASAAPEASKILGRDFSAANGTSRGTIPAFDSTADRNNDGYLSDTEYARRKSGSDARFRYESRLFYPFYGPMRYVVNPATQTIRDWAVDFHQRLLAKNPNADGIFIDNNNGKIPFSDIAVQESTANFNSDIAKLAGAVWNAVTPKLVVANTVGTISEADAVAAKLPGTFEEFLLRPTEANWTRYEDIVDIVNRRLKPANAPYLIIDSHPGSQKVSDPRVQIGTLAYYYLVADPDRTMLMFFGGYKPNAAWQDGWITAAETNVGKPVAAAKQFASGSDPENQKLEYRVYSREYDNALVLYKPKSYTRIGNVSGTINDATATTHNLNGKYQQLNADGSKGPVITKVTLRNGEGAVLLKVK